MTIPDFGVDRVEWNGLVLECRRVAPNLTLQDIVNAYHEATKDCTTADSIAGNPARWPTTKGVKAIVDLLLTAIYETHAFSPEEVENLWKYQTGPFHPFTCPRRGDGKHFNNGADLGALIPTTRGWICMSCDYTQNWAHDFMKKTP